MSSIIMKSSMLSARSVRPQAPVVHRQQAQRMICRSGTSGFESAGKDIKRATNKVGDQLADNIDSAQHKAGNAADDAGSSVKTNVGKGVDAVKDGLRGAGDKITDAAVAVGDTAKDLIEGGKKNIDKALH